MVLRFFANPVAVAPRVGWVGMKVTGVDHLFLADLKSDHLLSGLSTVAEFGFHQLVCRRLQ